MLRIAAIVLLFLLLAPVHLLTKLVARRPPVPPLFLAGVGWIIGTRVRVRGDPAAPHALLIANHSSWLDILVLACATGCAFVSKDELGHGLIHWLADQNGTIYVRRSHKSGAMDQAVTIARALEGARPVALFPEGTTGPGTHLLPFRPALLEAAAIAGEKVAIRPVAIDYGGAAAEVGWFDESGRNNVMRILGRRGTLAVTVHLLPALDRGGDRKQLARQAAAAIAQRLGFKSAAQSPIAAAG